MTSLKNGGNSWRITISGHRNWSITWIYFNIYIHCSEKNNFKLKRNIDVKHKMYTYAYTKCVLIIKQHIKKL